MNVYFLRADSDSYRSLLMKTGDLYDFARRFDGAHMKQPISGFEIGYDPRRLPTGDFPSLIPCVPVFGPRAVETLVDLLSNTGEFLPMSCGREQYFLFNVTRVIDALDELHSEIVRFDNSDEILNIRRYAFVKGRLIGETIFTVPQALGLDVFVTQLFVDRVREAGLRGFWLPIAWSGE